MVFMDVISLSPEALSLLFSFFFPFISFSSPKFQHSLTKTCGSRIMLMVDVVFIALTAVGPSFASNSFFSS